MSDQKNLEQGSFVGLLLRVYWMFIGNVASIIVVVWAFKSTSNSKLSLILLTTALVSNVMARYLDIKFYRGLTADADALATTSDFIRYSLMMILVYSAAIGILFLKARFI